MFPGPVCVSLTPRRVADVFLVATEGADCIEVRLDYLDDPDESAGIAWNDLGMPVIVTCRRRDRGGRFSGSAESELRILDRAVRNGARYVDVDYRIARAFPPADVIGSYHDFEGTPPDVAERLESICRAPVSVAKVATTVRSWSDNRRLLELLERKWPKPVIVVGMGPMGQVTRLVGPSRGSALTYAGIDELSAPGQLRLSEVTETYRFRQIGRDTRITGVMGNPVVHSRSPELHNRAFAVAGLDCAYLKFPVEGVADFFENAEPMGIVGFSVTIPHKVAVMDYLDELTPEAEAVGAVNTVYRENRKWKGDNTDVYGIRQALKGFDPRDKKVVIVGTGGAARAAVVALQDAASITLFSRRGEARTVNWSRRVRVERLENLGSCDADLLVNATPVGMSPDVEAVPVPDSVCAEVVFDMVYNPRQTRLLRQAANRGKRVIAGTAMFVAQAARQFEIWTGMPAPASVYSEELL